MIEPEIAAYYDQGKEQGRLTDGSESLELARTRDLLRRHLPPAPAAVLDVGGGAGVYAAWLAAAGYRVHLIDPMPVHVAQARAVAAAQPAPFAVSLGDARALPVDTGSVDAVLLLGPLYHLTEAADRLLALQEAWRVLRSGGVALAVGISRYASLHSALTRQALSDPAIMAMVRRDLATGQHRNPGRDAYWFTTAYFHVPDELRDEATAAGFRDVALLAVEGPAAFIGAGWADPAQRDAILAAMRAVEAVPGLLGVSAHIMAIGTKPDAT